MHACSLRSISRANLHSPTQLPSLTHDPRVPHGRQQQLGGNLQRITVCTLVAGSDSPNAGLYPSGAQPMVFKYHQIDKQTLPGISLINITADIRVLVEAAGLQEGQVTVLSRHTTTAVTINEAEPRLMDDIRQWLRKLAPPGDPYLHNDLHVRDAPPDWPGGHAAWVAQEPINAHSHLLSILIGNTQTIPVSEGKLCLGTWQSVLLVELDGPRLRTVGIQLVGSMHANKFK